jgi:hypothetical protein
MAWCCQELGSTPIRGPLQPAPGMGSCSLLLVPGHRDLVPATCAASQWRGGSAYCVHLAPTVCTWRLLCALDAYCVHLALGLYMFWLILKQL